ADHELDPGGDKIVGHRNALLGIADVVAEGGGQLLAEDPAGVVDVGNGLFGALLQLRAERGVRSGERPADAELDGTVLLATAGEREAKADGQAKRGERLH